MFHLTMVLQSLFERGRRFPKWQEEYVFALFKDTFVTIVSGLGTFSQVQSALISK